MELYEKLTDFDREIWAEELEEFVPAKVFDAEIFSPRRHLKPVTGC